MVENCDKGFSSGVWAKIRVETRTILNSEKKFAYRYAQWFYYTQRPLYLCAETVLWKRGKIRTQWYAICIGLLRYQAGYFNRNVVHSTSWFYGHGCQFSGLYRISGLGFPFENHFRFQKTGWLRNKEKKVYQSTNLQKNILSSTIDNCASWIYILWMYVIW